MNDLQRQLEFLQEHAKIFNIAAFSNILSVEIDPSEEKAPDFQEPPFAGELLKALNVSAQSISALLKFVTYFNWVVADGKVQINDTEMVELMVTILEIREFNDDIMIFTAEGWQSCDQKFLIKVINALSKIFLNHRASAHSRSESIVKALMYSHDVQTVEFIDDYVQLKNGVFNVKTGQIEAHKASIIPRIRLKVDLKNLQPLESKAPEQFKNFVKSITEGDVEYYEYLMDIIAYVIAPFKMATLKSVIFHGSGGNGKTLLMDVIRSLFETSAVTNTNLSDLNSEFGLSGLQKASLNISQEISASQPKPKAVQQLKAVLEESTAHLRVNEKYRPAKDYELNVKMLFGSNSVIDFGKDNRKPLSRRMVVLPFNFTPTNPDLHLKEKLEEEKTEILAFLLGKMHEIHKRGSLSQQPQVVIEEMDIWFHTNSVFVTKKPETEKAVRNWLQGKIVSQQGAKEVFQSELNKQIRAEVSDEATPQLCNQIIQNMYDTPVSKRSGDRYWKDIAYYRETVDLNSDQWTMDDDMDFAD